MISHLVKFFFPIKKETKEAREKAIIYLIVTSIDEISIHHTPPGSIDINDDSSKFWLGSYSHQINKKPFVSQGRRENSAVPP
jgi:hypothetical protein